MSDIARSAAFCRAIRDAVGDRADLLFGTHGQFTASGALRLAQVLEPYGPLWFEEPVPPDDLPGLARVAAGTALPVATGERLTTKTEFAAALAAGATIIQPATGRAGGLWETKKIAALAEAAGALVAPHLYAGPIEWAANVHVAATLPNLLMVETIETGGAFHRALIGDPIAFDAGYLVPPETPGLGIEVDEALARAHPYTGDRLHLDMQETPCEYSTENQFLGG